MKEFDFDEYMSEVSPKLFSVANSGDVTDKDYGLKLSLKTVEVLVEAGYIEPGVEENIKKIIEERENKNNSTG